MNDFKYEITISQEPIGYIVYISKNNTRLSFAEFCTASGMNVLGLMKVLTDCSGFKAEPADAIGFFLFKDNATKFTQAIKGALG